MNLPNEENSLLLSKFSPEIASQLLIQTTESQEYVQVPSIADDLLLTSLDDGTIAWTLGGLPVLLNGDNDNEHLFLNNLCHEETDREEESENISENLNSVTEDVSASNEITYPLEIPDKGFFTEDGLFITNEVINPQVDLSAECDLVSNDNIILNCENANHEENLDTNSLDQIQSSDISSQEAFIDINGMLIPQQTIINLENQDYFNIRDQTITSENLLLNNISSKLPNKRKCKRKITKSLKRKRKIGENLTQNYYSGDAERNVEIKTENGESLLLNCGDNPIKILNLSDPAALFNVENALLNNKFVLRNGSDIVAYDGSISEEVQAKLTDEPDSTVANDPFNIDDLATVVTAYQCKKCDFTCNNQDHFLKHFKETHIQPTNMEQKTDAPAVQQEIESPIKLIFRSKETKLHSSELDDEQLEQTFKIVDEDSDLDTINIIYTNDEYTEIDVTEANEVLTKFMEEQELQEMDDNSDATSNILKTGIPTNSTTDEDISKPQNVEEELDKKIMRIKRKVRKCKRNIFAKRMPVSFTPDTLTTTPDEIFEDNNVLLNDCPTVNEQLDATSDEADDSKSTETDDKHLIYLCSQCAEQFLTVEDCRIHMINDHNLCRTDVNKETSSKPAETSETNNDPLFIPQNSETDLQKKNKRTIDKLLGVDVIKHKKYKCTIRGCPYRFVKPELRVRHESFHVNNMRGDFHCTECNEKQSTWRLCSVHLWRNHQIDLDLYTCPLCNYKGTTFMKLKQHLKIHSDERDYVCPDCGRGFKQASQLRNHRVIHLDRRVANAPMWYIRKYCEKCGKMFADSKCLKKHVQAVHSKLKPFICNVCGHSCARKAMLQMHLRQHTGEKPYACKICFYKTGDHNSLRRHAMRHSGVRPYKCPHCDYTAIQSNSYKNHLANKHPGMSGSYNCTECPFKTVNEDVFSSHRNDHRTGLIDNNKNKTKDLSSNVTNTLNVIYDQLSTSSRESVTDEKAIYTVTSSPQKIILVSGIKNNMEVEDDETQNCFLSLNDLTDEQTVDTGGITIPADPEVSIDLQID